MKTSQFAYIETFGCQMNERDSEIMSQLIAKNYKTTTELDKADVVIVNTCSIRGKAEQKAFSLLGRLRRNKKQNPQMLIAVAGCVAQQQGPEIRKRMPHVDVVVGPQQIYNLSSLLQQAKQQRNCISTQLSDKFKIPAFLPDLRSGNPHKRFVTIMQGCNNFCTYCVVPYTRGREISRDINDIIAEVKHLAQSGVQEVTLLGQNVNSYGQDKQHEKRVHFSDLLHSVAEIDGIERIRFTTSHPKDLSVELMRCFSEVEKLCPHIHLPVQSGSNHILKKMNRKYSIEHYLEKVDGLKQYRPDIVITTDIIVGFPGETDTDFNETMDLLEKVRYHSAYSFKYSDRPQARSAAFSDKLPEDVKSNRLEILQNRQNEITIERHNEIIGMTMDVMVEGMSRSANGQWSGRTTTNHIVNFPGNDCLKAGQVLPVKITESCSNSLRGELIVIDYD